MSATYKTTGINLKSMPLGESDRLLTVLTREYGLMRLVAVGARKHHSRMAGRSALFVVNELLIAKGKSLDKIAQAETLESYPKLAQDLKKLTASQYLAELCLCQALSDQSQEDLFNLLNEHLKRIEQATSTHVLPHLTQAIFQLLVLSGMAPQVQTCCMTQQPLSPNFQDSEWRIGFSVPSGGTVIPAVLQQLRSAARPQRHAPNRVTETAAAYRSLSHRPADLHRSLTASELSILQHLAHADLPQPQDLLPPEAWPTINQAWAAIERALRAYAQYHFDRPIRSASLMDACFLDPSIHPVTP